MESMEQVERRMDDWLAGGALQPVNHSYLCIVLCFAIIMQCLTLVTR